MDSHDGDGSMRSDDRAARRLIPIFEGVGGFPEHFRDDLEMHAAAIVVDELLGNRDVAANLRGEGISLTRTGVTNLLSILTKGLVRKYRLDFDAGEFLEDLEDTALFFLTHNKARKYRGLDSARDTEEEARNLVRAFPTVLSRRDRAGYLPIHKLTFLSARTTYADPTNLRAISFVPLFAQQAIELGVFDEGQRGGLLAKKNGVHAVDAECSAMCSTMNFHNGANTLQALTRSNVAGSPMNMAPAEEHNKLVDRRLLAVMKLLVSMGLMTKDDIQEHDLLTCLCREVYFAEERFRFLSGWDPHALTRGDREGNLPLHVSSYEDTRGFRSVFEAGVDHFPKGEGLLLLFRKNGDGETPFELACEDYGSEKVIESVESALFRRDNRLDAEGAMLSAATDEGISLDGVYFLMRRMGVSLKMLPLRATAEKEGIDASVPVRTTNEGSQASGSRDHKQKR